MSINDSVHLSDEQQSLFIDQALDPSQTQVAQQHVAECARCASDIEDLSATVRLIRALPERRPPRSFVIGPRMAEPRLRWWDITLRGFAGAAAALFIVLLSGDLLALGRAGSTPSLAPISAPAAPQPALRSASDAGQAAPTPAVTATAVPRAASEPAPLAARPASAPSAPAAAPAPTQAAEAPGRVEALATRDTASSVTINLPPIGIRTIFAGLVALILAAMAVVQARRRKHQPPSRA